MLRPIFAVAALCLLGITIEATSESKCIQKAADIVFVLDSSTSIWIRNYRKQRQFVASLVDSFGVGHDDSKIRIGVITFSDDAYLDIPLDLYTDVDQLKETILNITHRRGETNTLAALRLLKDQVEPTFKINIGPTVGIVITDGQSMDPDGTKAEAKKLHQLGINVYAIGVGNSTMYDINELRAIASNPDTGVYTVPSYSELKNIRETFYVNICEGEDLTSKPTATKTTQATTTTRTTTEVPTTTQAPTTMTMTRTPITTNKPTVRTTTRAATTTKITTDVSTTTTAAPTTPTAITTEVPSTITTIFSTNYKKPTTKSSTVREPQNDVRKDKSSIILFGYDLVSVGAYGSSMIHQFINTILPYTVHGYFGIVSYSYCPTGFNVPMTSLMGKDKSTIKNSVVPDDKLPDLVDVVRKMRTTLYTHFKENSQHGRTEKQVAVLFVDSSTTAISRELIEEIEMLKKDGVELYLVDVGPCKWPQLDKLYSLSSKPYQHYIFNAPSYHQLVIQAQENPNYFGSMYDTHVPNDFHIS